MRPPKTDLPSPGTLLFRFPACSASQKLTGGKLSSPLPLPNLIRKFQLNFPAALDDFSASAPLSLVLISSSYSSGLPSSTFPGSWTTHPKLTCSCIFISWNLMNLEPRVCRYSRPPERLVWHSWLGHMIRGMKVGDWI